MAFRVLAEGAKNAPLAERHHQPRENIHECSSRAAEMRYALWRLRAAFFGFTARSLITSRRPSTVLAVSGNSRA